ncbi:MAG: helix-turn-helix domain-containing protein [Spirochaetia bacterium]|nr:helix-turn-helix domain-containing protein [Spirochaetia bacterium]MEE1269296.1 helix-turn-helix transcriptional regulator [Treponema sp.]
MSDFWKRVDEELDFLGISRTYLANKCEFSLTNIGQGIKLGSTPSADTAVKIAKVLNVSVEYLVTGQDSSLQKENLDLHRYREYSSFINQLDSLPENQRELIKSIVAKMNGWKN